MPDAFVARVQKRAGEQQRSVAKQLMRWAQLGAAVENNPDLTGKQLLEQYALRRDGIA